MLATCHASRASSLATRTRPGWGALCGEDAEDGNTTGWGTGTGTSASNAWNTQRRSRAITTNHATAGSTNAWFPSTYWTPDRHVLTLTAQRAESGIWTLVVRANTSAGQATVYYDSWHTGTSVGNWGPRILVIGLGDPLGTGSTSPWQVISRDIERDIQSVFTTFTVSAIQQVQISRNDLRVDDIRLSDARTTRVYTLQSCQGGLSYTNSANQANRQFRSHSGEAASCSDSAFRPSISSPAGGLGPLPPAQNDPKIALQTEDLRRARPWGLAGVPRRGAFLLLSLCPALMSLAMLTRLFSAASLVTVAALALGCRHTPGVDGIRTPVWVLGGAAVAHAQRFDEDSPRYDLYLASSAGSERLLKRVDTGGLQPRAVSPDGRRLAVIAGTTAHPSLLLVSLPDGDRRRLVRDADLRPEAICWSPDGTRLAVSLRDEDAFLLFDTASGARTRIPSQCPRVLSWLPVNPPALLLATDREPQEGNQIAFWSPSQPGTAPQEIFHTDGPGRIKTAVANAQGTQLAVLISDAEHGHSKLTLVDLQTRQAHEVWDSPRMLVGLQWSPEGDALYLTQLGREHNEGWILHRVNIATLSPEALVEHGPGWSLSPDGRRMVVAPGGLQRLRVFDLQPRQ